MTKEQLRIKFEIQKFHKSLLESYGIRNFLTAVKNYSFFPKTCFKWKTWTTNERIVRCLLNPRVVVVEIISNDNFKTNFVYEFHKISDLKFLNKQKMKFSSLKDAKKIRRFSFD